MQRQLNSPFPTPETLQISLVTILLESCWVCLGPNGCHVLQMDYSKPLEGGGGINKRNKVENHYWHSDTSFTYSVVAVV